MLRFNNGLTSAGAALTDPVAAALGAADGAAAWGRLLATLPSVADQFRSARAVLPFVHAPRVAFRSARVAGPGWALLPSAAGVIDPLLSTGFPLTLLGILRLVDLLERTSAGPERDAALADYERTTLAELDATERLVAALYATMDDPPLFKRLSLLYFAAASFSEAARRLGRPELAPGFLLCAHPAFGRRAGGLRVAGGGRSSGVGAARARGAHRPGDRAVRHGRPSRSRTARLVSRPRRGSPGVGGEAATRRRRRFSVFSSAAAWCRPRQWPGHRGREPAARWGRPRGDAPRLKTRQGVSFAIRRSWIRSLRNQKRLEANQTRILANQSQVAGPLAARRVHGSTRVTNSAPAAAGHTDRARRGVGRSSVGAGLSRGSPTWRVEAGILQRRLDVKELVDRQFIPADIAPARIDLPRRR